MAASMDNKISDDRRNREGPAQNVGFASHKEGSMETKDEKLLRIVRESDDQEYAVNLAIALISSFSRETPYTQLPYPLSRHSFG